MSDRLALANAIEDAGIERAKAERVASVIVDLIRDNVATKADVQASEAALRASIQGVQRDVLAAEAATRTLVAGEAARLDARIGDVRADLTLTEHRLITRLGGLAVVLTGIILAVLHYWQPHP